MDPSSVPASSASAVCASFRVRFETFPPVRSALKLAGAGLLGTELSRAHTRPYGLSASCGMSKPNGSASAPVLNDPSSPVHTYVIFPLAFPIYSIKPLTGSFVSLVSTRPLNVRVGVYSHTTPFT